MNLTDELVWCTRSASFHRGPDGERYAYRSFKPESEPLRLALIEWLISMGVDTAEVCAPGWIERRTSTNELVTLIYAGDGKRYFEHYLDPFDDSCPDTAALSVVVVRFDSEIPEFPPEVDQYRD